jgi:hypothetical protein
VKPDESKGSTIAKSNSLGDHVDIIDLNAFSCLY